MAALAFKLTKAYLWGRAQEVLFQFEKMNVFAMWEGEIRRNAQFDRERVEVIQP